MVATVILSYKCTAYLYLPSHPRKITVGISVKQVFLSALINSYKGPDIILDFNDREEIIGIEVLLD